MGLFNAAANLFGQVYERATQVAAQCHQLWKLSINII